MVLFRFYRIVGSGTDEYIGSTKLTLTERFGKHKSQYRRFLSGKTNNCGSFELFKKYGVDNCQIEYISELECESKKEARIEERRIYDERLDIIVNINRPYLSVEEIKEEKKEWYQANKDKIKEQNKKQKKEYRQANKERMKEQMKQYRQSNKDKIKEYEKANKDKINARKREKYHANKAKSIVKSIL